MLSQILKNTQIVLLFAPALFLAGYVFTQEVKAHPGNTAADGCHYCWTNCESWGEVYGERHCHGGSGGGGGGDTGGYVVPATPNYRLQGITNGRSEAQTTHRDMIVSSASTAGTFAGKTDGYKAGEGGQTITTYNIPSPANTPSCTFNVTFESEQNAEYLAAYKESWLSACQPIFDAAYAGAYKTAYSSSYSEGKTTYDEAHKNYWPQIIIGGIVALYAGAGIIGYFKDK